MSTDKGENCFYFVERTGSRQASLHGYLHTQSSSAPPLMPLDKRGGRAAACIRLRDFCSKEIRPKLWLLH